MTSRTDIEAALAAAQTDTAAATKAAAAATRTAKTATASARTAAASVAAASAQLATYIADHPTSGANDIGFVIGGAYGSNADPAPLEVRAARPVGSRRTYHVADATAAVKAVAANIAAGRRVTALSMRPAASWKSAAAGAADAWAAGVAATLAKLVAGTDHTIRFTIRHEPEGDTTNGGTTAAGGANFTAMQTRLAPYFDVPGIQFVIILMGYHSLAGGNTAVWALDKVIPDIPAIKGIGIDPYESYGITPTGASRPQGWKPFEATYFQPLGAFCADRGLAWGVSETGVNAAQFAARPTWFTDRYDEMVRNGGSWFDYFNTNLNSISGWAMEPDSPREKAFISLLRAHSA